MRYAIVTETYPPEINGVALTVQGLEQGLRERGNAVSVIRPRQASDAVEATDDDTLLVRGASLPRYPGLKFGLPATGQLRRHWQANRPDAIYVATEGPLGWSALRAARQLGIPAATGFHTRFDTYMRDYGLPMLAPVALRWMRHFHNSAQATLVPTRELQAMLESEGFDNVVRLARGSVWRRESLFLDAGAQGTADEPIVIEAYGTGEPPTIADPGAHWDAAKDFARNCRLALRKIAAVMPSLKLGNVKGGLAILPGSRPAIEARPKA